MKFFKEMFHSSRWRMLGEYSDIEGIERLEADAIANLKRHGGDPCVPSCFLDGNEVQATDLFYAGLRDDGYLFFGWKRPDTKGGGVWVLAGCQTLRLTEAKEYWSGGSSRKQQSASFVDAIEAWATGEPTRKRTPTRVTLKHVDEFLGDSLGTMFRNWMQHRKGITLPDAGQE